MRLRKWIALLSMLTAFACFGALADPNGYGPPINCAAGLRGFNGACWKICTSTSDCATGQHCLTIDTQAICVPYDNCAYLGDDTQCVGTQCTYYSRVGQVTGTCQSTPGANPNDVTPYVDETFTAIRGSTGAADGCEGDATWIVVPASGDPGCGQAHPVTRCRRFSSTCVLTSGQTTDFVTTQ